MICDIHATSLPQATDGDATSSRNSLIRYEIISGNYDKKFSVDPVTGVVKVKEPLLGRVISRRESTEGIQYLGGCPLRDSHFSVAKLA